MPDESVHRERRGGRGFSVPSRPGGGGRGRGGPGVVLPAAWAATQEAGGDGRRLLEAFVAGSEVAYAVALLCTTRHYFRGWWSTATFGVFGAAAAAARALELSAAQTTTALALAGTQ